MLPKGKDWLWMAVGAIFVMFVLPAIMSVLGGRRQAAPAQA